MKKGLDYYLEILFFLILITLTSIIFWKTFWVNQQGNIMIGNKLWSDFSATIPLIRSFSKGNNFPPQYPLFPGYPIRYHFIFYLLVGLLERIGIRIDIVLNTLSIIGFFALCVSIYKLASLVFKSKIVGVISTVFFLFNSSLSFLDFFKKHPLSPQTPMQIISNSNFSSFGPYDGGLVSAFWNLNIYTNQRHLALAYSIALFIVLFLFKKENSNCKFSLSQAIILGLIVGLIPFVHLAVFAMIGIFMLVFFLLYPKSRPQIFTAGMIGLALAIPQYLLMGGSQIDSRLIHPGYLSLEGGLTGFFKYWFYNLGSLAITSSIGFILASKQQRKIFVPFLILFAVGNLFQFTPEIAANHKFFNLFVIGANLFAANFIWHLWKKGVIQKVSALILTLFMIISGVIDLFPVINDKAGELIDIPNNKTAQFILKNTPADAVFLNSSFLYHPASLAGRKIFLGWPYFSWSAGYDTNTRMRLIEEIFSQNDRVLICNILAENNISYMTIEDTSGNPDFPEIDVNYFINNPKEYKVIYRIYDKDYAIIDVNKSCGLNSK